MSKATKRSESGGEEAEQIVLSFLIKTNLADRHPGVVEIQGRVGTSRSSHRIGNYRGVLLYEGLPGEKAAALTIARAIYQEETAPIQSAPYHGKARFDFSRPCVIHFFQQSESDLSDQPSSKREIGTLNLSGGIAKAEVVRRLAEVIQSGWEKPLETAYIPPACLTSEDGALLYERDGSRVKQVVSFLFNDLPIAGPLLLLAWSTHRMRFATLHLEYSRTGEVCHFYHAFTLLETERGWLLCDDGVHTMAEPFAMANRDTSDEPWYYTRLQQLGYFLPIRAAERATPPLYLYSDVHVGELSKLLPKASTSFSLYCTECQRGWLWEINEKQLREFSAGNFLLTLCPHCYFCKTCGRWSTPTTRSAAHTNLPCRHERPLDPEQRLAVQDWRAATTWQGSRILSSPHRVIPAVASSGDFEHNVLISFIAAWEVPARSAPLWVQQWKVIPLGTTLVGRGGHPQCEAEESCHVFIDDELWILPTDHVNVSCPLSRQAPALIQFEIAQKSLEEASALHNKGEYQAALVIYERALIELAVCGAPAVDVAPARESYARMLLNMGRTADGTIAMEEAANLFERARRQPYQVGASNMHFVQAEHVAKVLESLGQLYLDQGRSAEHLQRLARRLLALEALFNGSTEQGRSRLLELRLVAAQLLAAGDDTKEANRLTHLAEDELKYAPKTEQERFALPLARLRSELSPERGVAERLDLAHADILGCSVEQIREKTQAQFTRPRDWRARFFIIYLRANRAGREPGEIDIEEFVEGLGSRLLQGGKAVRVRELARQGTGVGACALAEIIYNDFRSRQGAQYHRDAAIDFRKEITLSFYLQVGVAGPSQAKKTIRYASHPIGTCAIPGGSTQSEACDHMAGVLDLGIRLLGSGAEVIPEPGSKLAWGEKSTKGPPNPVASPTGDDMQQLTRIRRYGIGRPGASSYRDYGWDVLLWVRTHLSPRDEQGCQYWRDEPHAQVEPISSLKIIPRELIWVIGQEAELPLHSFLWPQCGNPECVCPEHQCVGISAHFALITLGTHLGGRANAQYVIEDGKRSGSLQALTGALPTEDAFDHTDFERWRTSPLFAERYLKGQRIAKGNQQAASRYEKVELQKLLERLGEEQRQQIASLWGLRIEDILPQELSRTWALSVRHPFAARFVWAALSQEERTVLYAVLGSDNQAGILRLDLLRETSLAPEELDAVLSRLEPLLLLRITYTSIREDFCQVIGCPNDYALALYPTGKEFFSSQDQSRLTLSEYLKSLTSAFLSQIARQYDIALPHSASVLVQRRIILETLLEQPGRAFTELGRFNHSVQRIVAIVYEHNGRLSTEKAAALLEIDLPTLYDQLRVAGFLCLIFDAFAPGGERVLFIPGDLYEASLRQSAAPRTRQQLDDFFTPTYVLDGQPWLLYDLVAFLWFVYHSTIELTKNDLVPVRISKKIIPYLHLLPRDDLDGRDGRVDLLDFLAWDYRLEKKSLIEGVKTHYLPGERLGQWTRLDLATQTRLALIWWLQMKSWVDVIPPACREKEIARECIAARKLLVSALLALTPGRWYATTALLETLWKTHPDALRGKNTLYPALQHDRWMRAEGVYYSGLLAAALHELGIVALGYHHSPNRDLDTRLSPDLLQVTAIGREALTSPLNGFPTGGLTSAEGSSRPLIVQPNFEVLFLAPDHLQALYRVLPFVEIQQIERVSRTRLTQAALHDGMANGWTVEQVLAALTELSQKDLPQNITYELTSWANKHKAAQLSQVVLIEVSGESVAEAVCHLENARELGIRRIGPCLLAVPDPASLLKIRAVLLAEGIAVRIVSGLTAKGITR
jgi:tetratricopeptide (TPR) repeat protein